MIGSLGDTVFEASPERVRTIGGASRSGGSRWSTHDVHLRKPVSEFGGPGLESVSLQVRLDEAHGVDPAEEVDRLREARDAGEVLPFVLGGAVVGDFVVTDLSEQWRRILPSGRVAVVELEITLQEYV